MTTTTNIGQARYVLDPAIPRAHGRSPEAILVSRRCGACRSALEGKPLPDAQQQFQEIAECCAGQPGFITPDLSTLEIAFRIILQRGNEPTTLQALHSQLTEEWATPLNPRGLSPSSLRRLLTSDSYYGFKELAEGK